VKRNKQANNNEACGGVRLESLGTAALYRPIVPASDDR